MKVKMPTDEMLLSKYAELINQRKNYIECAYSDLDDSLAYIDRKIERFTNKLIEYDKIYLIQ